jgi:predicted helicase
VPDHDNLREIKTFPSLVKYLRDELDWPIEAEDFEDLTFDYEPEELGIDAKTAAKIEQIKQLRPLVSNQPWGIFFVKFEPKRLPVMALRRILSRLVIKKRTSAKKSDQPSWHLNDLLFISNYGEGEQRQITFAHFSHDEAMGDLPTLKVLGWDDADTALHIDHVHQELKEKLRWQEDDEEISDWKSRWSSLFTLRHREVITTSKALSERLAKLAADIRKRVNTILRLETDKGPIRKLQTDFKTALIHDLSDDDFADMYAQTITYGLLTARVSRPAGLVAENVTDMVPVTNPFLRDLMSTFLTIGGRKGKVDFDEVGINDVVQTLREANMEAVLRDFGDRKPEEDPVIFFYEDFLKAYDKKKKVQRGVFYTPKPVVSYIVRSVHELLQKEFGLEDGLADTTTWGEMIKKFPSLGGKKPGLQIPPGTSSDSPFVQILDPATGTGTFLVEVIDIIHHTLTTKWKQQGLTKEQQRTAWNDYVPKHLLPRLHGYELMMAPYAIAHMKIGLKLYETGYRFGSNERARIYLTNALDPPSNIGQLAVFSEALAHEAQAVNKIKSLKRFTVIIGNPPYSGHSANKSRDDDGNITFIGGLIERYKTVDGKPLGERQPKWLQDDYVKFIRFAQWCLDNTTCGQLGFITNHSYADNPTFRGMRQSILSSFDAIYINDLHGNSNESERAADGSPDENVFDIQIGVAIILCCKSPKDQTGRTVSRHALIGSRGSKNAALLAQSVTETAWTVLDPSTPSYLFIRQNTDLVAEYYKGWRITDVFSANNVGFVTARDAFVIDIDESVLRRRIVEFRAPATQIPTAELQQNYGLKNTTSWNLEEARRLVRRNPNWEGLFTKCLYRPFDIRYIYYSADMLERPVFQIQRHMLSGRNVGLLWTRPMSPQFEFSVGVTRYVADQCVVGNKSAGAGISYLGPLFLNPDGRQTELKGIDGVALPNFKAEFLKDLSLVCGIMKRDASGLPHGLISEDIFHYAYAVFHSPNYRSRYAEFLKIDFPRLPLTGNLELFRTLARIGDELVALHLMESPKLNNHITKWQGKTPSSGIEKVTYSDETVWIDKAKTEGFNGVPEIVWNFHIGGYQVSHKWLKDRKGRRLSRDDIEHYQKIVVALNETIRLMTEIDNVINAHGGWPGAFQTSSGVQSMSYEPEQFEYLKAAEEKTGYGKGSKEPEQGS